MRIALAFVICALLLFAPLYIVEAGSGSRLFEQIDLMTWGNSIPYCDSALTEVCPYVMLDPSTHTHRFGDEYAGIPYEFIPGYYDGELIGVLIRFEVVDAAASPPKPIVKEITNDLTQRFGKPAFKADAKIMMKFAGFPRAVSHWQSEGNHWILSHYLSSQGTSEITILGMSAALFDWYTDDFSDTTEVAAAREMKLFENGVSWFPGRSLLSEAQLTPLGEALKAHTEAKPATE